MIEIHETQDLDACLGLRFSVFVDEQNVPEELERDGDDATARHLLATNGGTAIGTARIVILDDIAKIGRVCVAAEYRGAGVGAGLIAAALTLARETPGVTTATLGSQTTAMTFYERFGFVAEGPEFDDAGIPHRMMRLDL